CADKVDVLASLQPASEQYGAFRAGHGADNISLGDRALWMVRSKYSWSIVDLVCFHESCRLLLIPSPNRYLRQFSNALQGLQVHLRLLAGAQDDEMLRIGACQMLRCHGRGRSRAQCRQGP